MISNKAVIFLFIFCMVQIVQLFESYAVGAETKKVIRIYQDADLSNHVESSWAIQKGIEVAFDEVGNEILGHKVEFQYLDHRGNVVRSKKNYEKFLADPDALAIYSGIHSPPLIKNRTFINENKALTLVPWAAGGPITRHPGPENWVFRLSVDDTRAGPILVDYAIKEKSCNTPYLILEDTPWGDSNLKSMEQSFKQNGIDNTVIKRFGWNITPQGARSMVKSLRKDTGGVDKKKCILLVANAIESAVIVDAIINSPDIRAIPIISHWGLAAGDFHDKITPRKRTQIDLSFIQSCFAFTNEAQSDFAQAVFRRLVEKSKGSIQKPKDLKSAVGFIHAYDLTRLLIAAMEQAGLSGDVEKDRDAIRRAFENLEAPIQGLVKMYQKPYSVFNEIDNINAHEALHKQDYCMARYGDENEVVVIRQ